MMRRMKIRDRRRIGAGKKAGLHKRYHIVLMSLRLKRARKDNTDTDPYDHIPTQSLRGSQHHGSPSATKILRSPYPS